MKPSMRKTITGARADFGLSLQDLAGRAGITKSHLWDLEQGRSVNPTVLTIHGLSEALHQTFGYLAEGAKNDALERRASALPDACDASDAAETLYQRTGGPTEGLKQVYASLLENEKAKKVEP